MKKTKVILKYEAVDKITYISLDSKLKQKIVGGVNIPLDECTDEKDIHNKWRTSNDN